MSEAPLKFEDKIEELDDLLLKNKGKWQLDALAWIDYDDVCQIIRTHVYVKWEKWDQSRPFKPWVNTLIHNQIINQIRNVWGNYAKPCTKCPHNMGGDHCYLTKSGIQDSTCEIYEKWEKKKKNAYNVKLPVSIEDVTPKRQGKFEDSFCYERSRERLHKLVIEKLSNERQKKIYSLLYVEEKPEEEVAKIMGFKPDPSAKRRKVRYKQIANLQKKFKAVAKKILETEDIFY